MPDEYATRTELNGFGSCVNRIKEKLAACAGDKGARLTAVENWVKDLDKKSESTLQSIHVLELNMSNLGNELVKKMSVRMGIFIAIATTLITAVQIWAAVVK